MLKSQKSLLRVLDISQKQLDAIFRNYDTYYYKKEIDKKDSFGNLVFDQKGRKEKRILYPSKDPLKRIQARINRRLFSGYKFLDNIQGSVKGKSSITNAKYHQGNKFFLLTDLRKYFPSVHFREVYKALIRIGYGPNIASALTRITTKDKALPQGTPTSPFLSNLVFEPYDNKLIEISNKYGLKYTRYIDDLTFSSRDIISKEVVVELLDVIRKSPYRYHHRKTRLISGIVEITGIRILNNGLDVPIEKYLKLNLLDPNSNQYSGLNSFIEATTSS